MPKAVPKSKKARCRCFGISPETYDVLMLLPGYDPFRDANEDDGYCFDEEAAIQAISFFPTYLTHVKGDLSRKPFILEPWQSSVIANVWGWRDALGRRRYRWVFIYVPKKNGKTTFAAGIVLLVLVTDHEAGAEIYGLGASKEQASYLFQQVVGMVKQEPELDRGLHIFGGRGGSVQKAIMNEAEMSSYRVIAADADSADGANVHCAVLDELHRYPKREIVDVIELSTIARSQPLVVYTTTADFNRPSICNEKLTRARAVRDGDFRDARFLPVVYEATNDDDWTDPKVWRAANPNLGVTFPESGLADLCRSVKASPAQQNNFKRLHLNIVTDADVVWIPREAWVASAGPTSVFDLREALKGRECYGGLDLSEKLDITALILVFPRLDKPGGTEQGLAYDWLGWFFIPDQNAIVREERDGVPYTTWAAQDYVIRTEGDVVDHEFIKKKILALSKVYKIKELGYDPWNATQLATQLHGHHGLPLVEVRQGYHTLSEPCKTFEALVHGARFRHGGNPVMDWMVANTMVKTDPSGNIKPDKSKSTGRIDGVAATVTALARAVRRKEARGGWGFFIGDDG